MSFSVLGAFCFALMIGTLGQEIAVEDNTMVGILFLVALCIAVPFLVALAFHMAAISLLRRGTFSALAWIVRSSLIIVAGLMGTCSLISYVIGGGDPGATLRMLFLGAVMGLIGLVLLIPLFYLWLRVARQPEPGSNAPPVA